GRTSPASLLRERDQPATRRTVVPATLFPSPLLQLPRRRTGNAQSRRPHPAPAAWPRRGQGASQRRSPTQLFRSSIRIQSWASELHQKEATTQTRTAASVSGRQGTPCGPPTLLLSSLRPSTSARPPRQWRCS